MVELSKERQALVQTFIAQRGMRLADLDRVLQTIYGDSLAATQIDAAYIANEVSTLNTALADFDFEIRRTVDQRVGGDFWVLVNATADSMTQLATTHTPNEIAYFRSLLYVICSANNTRDLEALCVSQQEALSYAHAFPAGYQASQAPSGEPAIPAQQSASAHKKARRGGSDNDDDESVPTSPAAVRSTQSALLQGPGLTRTAAKQALDKFVQEAWLHKSSSDYYSLTPKSLMELHVYLQEMYGQDEESADADNEADAGATARRPQAPLIKPCSLCRELTLIGYRCPDLDCLARIHSFCFKRWTDMRAAARGQTQCPKCKAESWERQKMVPVGERAFAASPSYRLVGQQQAATSRRARAALLEEADDSEEQSSQAATPSASTSQRHGVYEEDDD